MAGLQQRALDALRHIERRDVGNGAVDAESFVDAAAWAGPQRAVPVLESFYAANEDKDVRDQIASVLVRLGDAQPMYWQRLEEIARRALEANPPFPFSEQAQGNAQPAYSAEFTKWAQLHKLSLDEAYGQALVSLPRQIVPLARSGDRRGIPLLLQALSAKSGFIQEIGADGLAATHDVNVLPAILQAVQKAPELFKSSLADSLLYFHDPQADRVFLKYHPGVNLEEARRFREDDPYRLPPHAR